MRTRLIQAAGVLVPFALACLFLVLVVAPNRDGPKPDPEDAGFARAVAGLDLPVNGVDPEVANLARDACAMLEDGDLLTVIYDKVQRESAVDTEAQARSFVAASMFSYCPDAV